MTVIVLVCHTAQVNYQTLSPESSRKAYNRIVELTRLRKKKAPFRSVISKTVLSRVSLLSTRQILLVTFFFAKSEFILGNTVLELTDRNENL